MSRTKQSPRGAHRASASHAKPRSGTGLPEAFVAEMEEQLLGIGHVLDSYDLLVSLMDRLERTSTPADGIDQGELSACMRILNNEHFMRLGVARDLLVRRRPPEE